MNRRAKDYTHYYDLWKSAMGAAGKSRAESDAHIDNIIDALGMREAYPDIPHKGYFTGGSITGISNYGLTVSPPVPSITYGRDKFLADVKLAADAAKGKEAADRLAAALKPKK